MSKRKRIKALLEVAGSNGCYLSSMMKIFGWWIPAYSVLWRMEEAGEVESAPEGVSYPRRTRYWLKGQKP